MQNENNCHSTQRKAGDLVLVSVAGIQKGIVGDEDRIELITTGERHEKDGICYITYRENLIAADGLGENCTTILKLCPEYMVLTRSGTIEQQQEFFPGKLCVSSYITPYGAFDMGVLTTDFIIARSEIGAIAGVNVDYELHIDGRWLSSNSLSINITENIKGEKDFGH